MFSYKRASQKNHEICRKLKKSVLGPAVYNLPRGTTPKTKIWVLMNTLRSKIRFVAEKLYKFNIIFFGWCLLGVTSRRLVLETKF